MDKESRDHDTIKHRQRKVSAAYSESKPSEVTDVYWIYAENKTGTYPAATLRSGTWLVFVNVEDADELWAKIKKATEEGKLGQDSKVATAKPSQSPRRAHSEQ